MESKTKVQQLIREVLANNLGVRDTYRHAPKQVTHGRPIVQSNCILKWYEVFPTDSPIPQDIRALARAKLDEGRMSVDGLGAVILHRCTKNFYFLIVSTWRNENELWEAVWYKDDISMGEFLEFPRNSHQKPAFCVWELVPICHESQSWQRFLESNRDAASAEAWLADVYSGTA